MQIGLRSGLLQSVLKRETTKKKKIGSSGGKRIVRTDNDACVSYSDFFALASFNTVIGRRRSSIGDPNSSPKRENNSSRH